MHAVVGMWDMDLSFKQGQAEELRQDLVSRQG